MGSYCDTDWYETVPCANCGIRFGAPTSFIKERREDKKTFYCPSGHQNYYAQSETDRLKKEIDRQQQMTDAANARACKMERDRDQIASAHRKMCQRVVNGVCPCCTRTFQNLLRHMQTEHPEFKDKMPLAIVRQSFGLSQVLLAKEAGINAAYVSSFERGKPVPQYAHRALESWLERHTATAT